MNSAVAIGVLVLILGALRLQGMAVSRGLLRAAASRKAAHLGLGTLLILSWLLYDSTDSGRWLAALPPAGLAFYFLLLGTGRWADEGTVRSLSRSGTPREMLFGPLLFCAPFALVTVLFWRSPVSVAALSFLVFGDGIAEVASLFIRSPSLPWNRRKTVSGTAAAFVCGWLGGWLLLFVFGSAGFLGVPPAGAGKLLLGVAAAGALAESLSPGRIDNLVITIIATATAALVF